jgi:hypothetical protein
VSFLRKARFATADVPIAANNATATADGIVDPSPDELWKIMSPP